MKYGKLTPWYGCTAAALAVAALVVIPPPAPSQEHHPEELLKQAQQLERKAQDLKADGRHEEARELMREVEAIHARAEHLHREPGPADERHRQELKQALKESLVELEELRAAGKMDEAAEVKHRVEKLENELARLSPQPAAPREGERAWEGPPRPDRRPELGPGEVGDMQRRLHHLELAIDNLHAAGMHEAAERLAQEAGRLRQHMAGGPPPERGRPGPGEAEFQRLRAEIQELRQAVRELRARVDELGRERR